jgi:hypothetical protein
MNARLCLASVLPFLLTAAPGCVRGKTCSLIGCVDQASVAIHRADWMMLSLAVELDIDGRKVVCAAPDPQQTGVACDSNVRIEVRQLTDCHDTSTPTAKSQTCTPNGRFEDVITIPGTPALVSVTLKSGGVIVGQRDFQPAYTSARPNGPGCDPVCRQSTQTWEVGGLDVDAGGDVGGPPADAARDARADGAADAPNDVRPDGISLDAPGDRGAGDALDGGATCGMMACAPGEVCVRDQVLGGACLQPGDAGCPPGFTPGGVCCVAGPGFHCADRPAACGSTLTCACAASALCRPGAICGTPSTTEIDCTLLAP